MKKLFILIAISSILSAGGVIVPTPIEPLPVPTPCQDCGA